MGGASVVIPAYLDPRIRRVCRSELSRSVLEGEGVGGGGGVDL